MYDASLVSRAMIERIQKNLYDKMEKVLAELAEAEVRCTNTSRKIFQY